MNRLRPRGQPTTLRQKEERLLESIARMEADLSEMSETSHVERKRKNEAKRHLNETKKHLRRIRWTIETELLKNQMR